VLWLDKVFGWAQSPNMKPRFAPRPTAAMTLVELVVVLSILAILLALLLPTLAPAHGTRQRINCVNNLKQIGLSYRIWSGDNLDKYPFEVSVTNGGTKELLFGRNAWLNFLVMSNELSTPKILICPEDLIHQPPATNFSAQLAGHLSYFVGLDAAETHPQTMLSGDANFQINGVPVKSGILEITSNTPIAWTRERHRLSGNIVLADGSVQTLSNAELPNQIPQTGLATNRLAIP
jgi:type II secretory pathway pseudopilin PulG